MIDEAAPRRNLIESDSLTMPHLLCVLLDPSLQDGELYLSLFFFCSQDIFLSFGLYSLCCPEVIEEKKGARNLALHESSQTVLKGTLILRVGLN